MCSCVRVRTPILCSTTTEQHIMFDTIIFYRYASYVFHAYVRLYINDLSRASLWWLFERERTYELVRVRCEHAMRSVDTHVDLICQLPGLRTACICRLVGTWQTRAHIVFFFASVRDKLVLELRYPGVSARFQLTFCLAYVVIQWCVYVYTGYIIRHSFVQLYRTRLGLLWELEIGDN